MTQTTDPIPMSSLSMGTSSGSVTTGLSGAISGSGSGSTISAGQQHLVTILGIPPHLVGGGPSTLQIAYQKYKAYYLALDKLEEMMKDGVWLGAKPTQGAIKDLFCSRSYFSSHLTKFKKVMEYPEMKKWLDDDLDKLSDSEVWGLEKDKYTFIDLDTYVAQSGILVVSKERGTKKRKKPAGKVTQKTVKKASSSGSKKKSK